MRIAHVNQDPGVDPRRKKGAAVHLAMMRSAFDELGADVISIDSPNGGEITQRLSTEHTGSGLDLIYERYALGAFACSRFAHEHGVRHVLEVNAPLAEETRRYRPGTAPSVEAGDERSLFSNAALIVAVSQAMADYAIRLGARADRVSVHPNGVDARLFRPRKDDLLRDRVLPPQTFVIGFHGRLRPWHQFGELAMAVREVIATGVPAHVFTVGEGPFREALVHALPRKHFTHKEWVPYAELPALVACFDVLALSYSPDANFYFSPLKLLEGMATGAVPVVPDVGDLPSIVQDGQNGLVYPAGDRPQLVHALRSLYEDPVLRLELSRAARDTARSRSWESIARSVLEQVSEVAP